MITLEEYFSDDFSLDRIDEETYKELLNAIDPDFLRRKIRLPKVPGIHFEEFNHDIMHFIVPTKYNTWNTYIKMLQWDELGLDKDLTWAEKGRMAIWISDIQVYCDCPSHAFQAAYVLTLVDACIVPEDRPSNKTNPVGGFTYASGEHVGGGGPEGRTLTTCKHVNKTLKLWSFFSGTISNEMKRQFKDLL